MTHEQLKSPLNCLVIDNYYYHTGFKDYGAMIFTMIVTIALVMIFVMSMISTVIR